MLAAVLTLAAVTVTNQPAASAQGSGCANGPVAVFDGDLRPPWYPASWSGTTVDNRGDVNQIFFPLRWSAYSVAANPVDVAGCTTVEFDVVADGNPTLGLRLNNNRNESAGLVAINDARSVSVPLDRFDLPGAEVTRFSIINQSGRENVSLTIGNIRFVGPTVDDDDDDSDPDLPEPGGICAEVYRDRLAADWQPASWTVSNLTYTAGGAPEGTQQISTVFPQRWGAVSHLATAGVDVGGCTGIAFLVRVDSSSAKLDLRLNTSGGAKAGDSAIDLAPAGQVVEVVVPLTEYDLAGDIVTRISFLNRSSTRGVQVWLDDIRFVGPDVDPDIDPDPDGPIDLGIGSGINLMSGEYACVGTRDDGDGLGYGFFDHLSVGVSHTELATTLKQWNVQTVRLPMNEHCWLGGAEFGYIRPEFRGAAYRAEVTELMDALHAQGIRTWLEMHWSNERGSMAVGQTLLPDTDYAEAFWSSVASTYRDRGDLVMYGPFNEPRAVSSDATTAWRCWRDGCAAGGRDYVGMQALVDAIRSTGSDQYIALGGLNFANDVTRWLDFVPDDAENRLLVDFHAYDFNPCLVACFGPQLEAIQDAGYGVVLGEFGQGVRLGESRCRADYPNQVMDWAESAGVPFLGWTFNAAQGQQSCRDGGTAELYDGNISLVTSWSGDATEFGAALRSRLQSAGSPR